MTLQAKFNSTKQKAVLGIKLCPRILVKKISGLQLSSEKLWFNLMNNFEGDNSCPWNTSFLDKQKIDVKILTLHQCCMD